MSRKSEVFLPRRAVERYTGLSRTTIYRKKKEGTFPVPIRMADRAVRWLESDIRKYVNSRPRAQDEKANQKKQRPTPKPKPKPKKRPAQ